MIFSFFDQTTCDIFEGLNSKPSRRIPRDIHAVAKRKLDMIDYATGLSDLKCPPANRLELLKGSLAGCHSIRINDQWRIVFRWTESGAEDVRIMDYN